MENNKSVYNENLFKNEITYNSQLLCLNYHKYSNLLCGGDEKGKISFFDIRLNKAVKLIKNDKNSKNDIKYIFIKFYSC